MTENGKKRIMPIAVSVFALLAIVFLAFAFGATAKLYSFSGEQDLSVPAGKPIGMVFCILGILGIAAHYWIKLFSNNDILHKTTIFGGLGLLSIGAFIYLATPLAEIYNKTKMIFMVLFLIIQLASVVLLVLCAFLKKPKLIGVARALSLISILGITLVQLFLSDISSEFGNYRFVWSDGKELFMVVLAFLFGCVQFYCAEPKEDAAEQSYQTVTTNKCVILAASLVGSVVFAFALKALEIFFTHEKVLLYIIKIILLVPVVMLFAVSFTTSQKVQVGKQTANTLAKAGLIIGLITSVIFAAVTIFSNTGDDEFKIVPFVIFALFVFATTICGLVTYAKFVKLFNKDAATQDELSPQEKEEIESAKKLKAEKGEGALWKKGDSKFDGGLLGLIGTNIWTTFITLITLTFALPWMICAKQRWYARHTVIDGRRLKFKAKGVWLIGTYIKWILLTLITIGIFALWIPVKLEKWTTKHTVFVDSEDSVETSVFSGGLLGLIGVNLATFFGTIFTLGIAIPWLTCFRMRWQAGHTKIEGHQEGFNGKGGNLFGSYIKWFLLTIVTIGIYAFWVGIKMLKWETKNLEFVDVTEPELIEYTI